MPHGLRHRRRHHIYPGMRRTVQSIIDDFDLLDDWEDKYRFVIELGRELPELPASERNEANRVHGCVSQVWVVTDADDAGIITFRGDSDAHIVRGLVAIMLTALSGHGPDEIVAFDAESLFQRMGLDTHLTPQRSNGLRAMVKRMKSEAVSRKGA